MQILPLEREHLNMVDPQATQVGHRELLDGVWDGIDLELAFSLEHEGHILAAAGIHDHIAWALLGRNLGGLGMFVVSKAALVGLENYGSHVYAEIDPMIPNTVRWACALGFIPFDRRADLWIYPDMGASE